MPYSQEYIEKIYISDGHDTENKYLDTIPILQILTILYPILYYTVW
jgi:hypothetical protein